MKNEIKYHPHATNVKKSTASTFEQMRIPFFLLFLTYHCGPFTSFRLELVQIRSRWVGARFSTKQNKGLAGRAPRPGVSDHTLFNCIGHQFGAHGSCSRRRSSIWCCSRGRWSYCGGASSRTGISRVPNQHVHFSIAQRNINLASQRVGSSFEFFL